MKRTDLHERLRVITSPLFEVSAFRKAPEPSKRRGKRDTMCLIDISIGIRTDDMGRTDGQYHPESGLPYAQCDWL